MSSTLEELFILVVSLYTPAFPLMSLCHQMQDWRSETSSQFATHFSPSQAHSVLLVEVLLSSQQQHLKFPVKIYIFKWHLSQPLSQCLSYHKTISVNLSTFRSV